MIYLPKLTHHEDPNTPDLVKLNLNKISDLTNLNQFINTIDIQRDSEALKSYFGERIILKETAILKFQKTFDWVRFTRGRNISCDFR